MSSDPSPPTVTSTFSPADAAIFAALSSMWGLSFLFIKVAVESVAPIWIVAIRTAVGGMVLLAILLLRRTRLPRGSKVLWHLLVLGVLSNALPWTVVAWAEESISSGLAAIVNSLTPASTLAIAAAIGQEHLTGRKIAGLAVALLGTLVVMSGEFGSPERLLALAGVVGATVLYGAGAVYAKQYVSGRHAPLAVATGQVTLSAVVTLPAAALFAPTPDPGSLEAGVTGSLVALGVFGTGLAFLAFYTLIERVGATNATMVTYAIPVIGVVAGWLVLGETVGWNVLLGGPLVIVGIWMAQRQRTKGPATALAPDKAEAL